MQILQRSVTAEPFQLLPASNINPQVNAHVCVTGVLLKREDRRDRFRLLADGICERSNSAISQLSAESLRAVLSVPNIFVFGVNTLDAKLLAPVFNGRVSAEALACQEPGSVYARLGEAIVHFKSPFPLPKYDAKVAEQIIRYSREHYYASTATPVVTVGRRPRVIETLEDA